MEFKNIFDVINFIAVVYILLVLTVLFIFLIIVFVKYQKFTYRESIKRELINFILMTDFDGFNHTSDIYCYIKEFVKYKYSNWDPESFPKYYYDLYDSLCVMFDEWYFENRNILEYLNNEEVINNLSSSNDLLGEQHE